MHINNIFARLNTVESLILQTARELNARKALAEARQGNDLEDLRAAVNAFEGQGLYETDGAYGKAAKKLEYLELVRGKRHQVNMSVCFIPPYPLLLYLILRGLTNDFL